MTGFSCAGVPTLADLSGALASQLGMPGDFASTVPLPDQARFVLVLVDGLGWDITRRALPQAPYLAGLIGDALKLCTGMPTTTAVSLMSLWTGRMSGGHGVVGFSFESPPNLSGSPRGLVTPLFLRSPIQSAPSLMDELQKRGVAVTFVIPKEHVGTGLTQMATTTATMIGVDSDDDETRIQQIVSSSRRGDRSLVYAYEGRLDASGHRHGVSSRQWSQSLTRIDQFLEDLRDRLDDDVCLVVTGDHGMIDVAREDRIDIDTEPSLRAQIALVGGEARFRHLYTDHPRAVAKRWSDRLGDEAWVMLKDQAVREGVFGQVDARYLSRIGDVVVIPTGGQAYLSATFPGEYYLVGMHGAATSSERHVPAFVDSVP